jgi:hypothetical protein
VFNPEKVADAMEAVSKTISEKREAIKNYPFKSWSRVCDGFLEDLLMFKA